MNRPHGGPGSELGCPECFPTFHAGFARCPFDASVLETGVRDRLLGHILNGRYILQELVGVGSVGRVYKARHVRLDRVYAIKIRVPNQDGLLKIGMPVDVALEP